ncbi:MAG TPA: DUF2161 domain-containing phosphodiesterase, partial [Azospirillaceae bacterium]|nr:DUF2161 domain-containing phosphodiesterase [Azospirillaceae bacterium]
AVPRDGRRKRSTPCADDAEVKRLCRMLGLGLLVVDPRLPSSRQVEVLVDPAPYRPRKDRARTARLLSEHARRTGDANIGGSTRVPIVTAYRQEALRCAALLHQQGAMAVKALRDTGQVPNAGKILQRDVYGWFQRVERGIYTLSEGGTKALEMFAHALAED